MKHKSKSLKKALFIVCIVAALMLTANYFGIGTMRSASCIGYTGHDGWRNWSASYTRLDGKMKHTIRPKDNQKTLHVEVVTEEGSLSMKIKDAKGNILFEKEQLETSEFDVKAEGKAVVSIEAKGHKGSFLVEAAE